MRWDVSLSPYIAEDTPAYLVVYKPPRLHSVPLKDKRGENLLDWCAKLFPEVLSVRGKNPWEGGVLHRLDFETHGLVLIAKTQSAFDGFSEQQEKGLFVKTYRALTLPADLKLRGFPPPPVIQDVPCVIESAFRPFGEGRKSVRPVLLSSVKKNTENKKNCALDRGEPYITEITEQCKVNAYTCFTIRLKRGFRHQIRCHLAWLGFPILNDPLYGGAASVDFPYLALSAVSHEAIVTENF